MTFISHISLPDGTTVTPGQSMVKTWRVKNSGTSTWSGFKLVFNQGEQMGGPGSVTIPTTAPGQEVDISVNLTAPSSPGNKYGAWQIVNAQGVHVDGGKLWVSVNVVDTTPPANDHIAAFSADPSPPSSANPVNIYARLNWWDQYRAMRVLVDNQVIGETSATEHTFTWNTSSASTGAHTVVLEVDDLTGPAWDQPERRVLSYNFTGSPAPANHAPNRPSPTSPYDWYVYYSGNTAQLCAQANGDPDGDAITGYYFDIFDSAQLWNSGWVGSNCVTTGALGPYTYQWRVKVRDSPGAASDWSDSRHFTLVNPNLSITELYFQSQDSNSEQVKIRACTAGQGGVGITMRVSVNDANDGSGNGEWHIIKELGVPCFSDVDAPIWYTLDYGDGSHRVRVEAHGVDASWNGAAVREDTFTLPHRRPGNIPMLAPRPVSGDYAEAIYLNSRTVTFRWGEALRATDYTLHLGTGPDPAYSSSPVFRQTFGPSVTEYTVTLDQDYPTLYWQVSTTNDKGITPSNYQRFGIHRTPPTCSVQALPAVNYETVFQVNWAGSDNLAGLRGYDIQVKDSERGQWDDWLANVVANRNYELFTGQPGHSYAFRCRATDKAGNTGNYPPTADTTTTIDPTARPQTPWWNPDYGHKHNLTILNNMSNRTLQSSYPVRLHFDSNTTPTAAEIYNASQSSPKCNDVRVVYNDTTELDRYVQTCSSTAINIWFRTQVSIPAASSNNTAHQLYYGNPNPGTPPGNPTTVFDPPNDANTVSLWYMNEGSGTTLTDSSGHSHNCSITTSTTWVGPTKFTGALHFPGGTDGSTVNCGTSSAFNLQTFTFEMFLKRTGTAWGRIAGHLGNDQNRWLINFNENGSIRISIWPCTGCGAQDFNSNRTINDTSNWHHIAFTLQSSTLKIYIDGQLDKTGQVSGGNIRSGTPPLTLGSAENIFRAYAEMTHVRLSNIARTSFPYGAVAAITSEPTVALGDQIDPPEFGTPDLVVLSMSTYPNPEGGVLVEAVVQNQGDLSTRNGFYTDLYADHVPTGPNDYTGSLRYWVASPIEARAIVTLITVITDLGTLGGLSTMDELSALEETSTILYAQTDSSGVVGEPDDTNNIYATGTEICVAGADSYEQDDASTSATPISVGSTQAHNMHSLSDQDWLNFEAAAGESYTIETGNLGVSADTYLYLYDTDGSTLLAGNDDYGGTLASRIEWIAPADGTYFVLVKHWNPNVSGCGTSYEISVRATPACTVWETPFFSEVYGGITIDSQPAPTGTIVQARSPRGDVVACYVVDNSGQYGLMRIYGEDTSATPPIAGMQTGELVSFEINGVPATALPVFTWQDDKTSHGVDLAAGSITGQPILLNPGWNLNSINVTPPDLAVTQVLTSINGQFDRVLGETGIFDITLADEFNTLQQLQPGLGYYLRITTTTSIPALVQGPTVPVTTPIPLHSGWNWLGYLPTTAMPITQALQSIDGSYQRVLSIDRTFDTNLPDYSTLRWLEPGQGYLIYAAQPVSLTYPVEVSGSAVNTVGSSACDGLSPTPYRTLVYGPVEVNGRPAPVGTKVEVRTPRSGLAGCFVVQNEGKFGLMPVFGEDATANPPIDGFRPGEALTFFVNGQPADTTSLIWQDDWTTHLNSLSGVGNSTFLPVVIKNK